MKLETWERQETITHVKSLWRSEGWYPKQVWAGLVEKTPTCYGRRDERFKRMHMSCGEVESWGFKMAAFRLFSERANQDLYSPSSLSSNTHTHFVSLLTPLFIEQLLCPVTSGPFLGFYPRAALLRRLPQPTDLLLPFLKQSWLYHSTASDDLMAFHYSRVK